MEAPANQQPPTNSDTTIWQLVIHREISQLDFLWPYLKTYTQAYLANQHDADEEINRTHTHVMIRDISISKQSLSKFINKNDIRGSDNFGILTVYKASGKPAVPYEEDKLGPYVIKGNLELVQYYVYEEYRIIHWAEQWINHKSKVQFVLQELDEESQPERKQVASQWERHKMLALKELTSIEITLEQVRKWYMRLSWKESGRLPQATAYKRNACSIYYMLIENITKNSNNRHLDSALEEIMMWNY